jgi:hypothetical protein
VRMKKLAKGEVWHISRFRERYELPDDIRYDRTSPLIYTKDFVGSGSDDESCAYWRQLMAMRSKTNWLVLRGAFAELKNIAGNMSKEYRGYLLDSNFKPASVKEIGRWLGVGEKKAQMIIEELRDVGLLEYVAIPQFNGQPRKRTGKSGRARKRTEKPGKARKPLKKKTKVKTNVKNKAKAKINGSGKTNKKFNNRQRQERKGSNTGTVKSKITTPLPAKSQEAATGERGVIKFQKLCAPPRADNDNRSGLQRLGDIVAGTGPRYSRGAKDFGADIYHALGLSFSPLSVQGRRELGSFASLWERTISSGISPSAIQELRERALVEAVKIAKRRRRCRSPGAVFCHVFARLLAAMGPTPGL